MSENLSKIAQKYFISGNFDKALELYEKLDMPLEIAYCEIYLGHLPRARKFIEQLNGSSPAEEWIVSFLQMIDANLVDMPSFLQIRNFFEIDLNNLFLCANREWIENVINYVPSLATINSEVYKLAARVLKNNGQEDLAKLFLEKSLDIYFQDSETHFMLAEIYMHKGNQEKAKKHLEYACEQEPYFPAEKLLEQLIEK